MEKKYKKLSPEEEDVIVAKGTERPFTGEFWNFNKSGIYSCKRCGAALYRSEDKFDSGCGWPSFDDEVPGAVRSQPDSDGVRTEIVCANCGAHLGHIFSGEGKTPKNIRYCVNSISLDFKNTVEENLQKAYFAGGCFWGMEYCFQNVEGVVMTRVGYMGGTMENPTYKDVCSGRTGHAESLEIVFDPEKTDYESLVKIFFEIHDPTQKNRQGPDIGEQYRSAIFYKNGRQKKTAMRVIKMLEAKGIYALTKVLPAEIFYPAEDYHNKYYSKTGKLPYCHMRKKIF
jgi:peptide methionine sulfoxide reductase msrA/msrB